MFKPEVPMCSIHDFLVLEINNITYACLILIYYI